MAETSIERDLKSGDPQKLLYLAVRELSYVQEAVCLSSAKSSLGEAIIEHGMKLLGITSLESDTYPTTVGGER